MRRESHVRFCEGVGARFPRATRHLSIMFSRACSRTAHQCDQGIGEPQERRTVVPSSSRGGERRWWGGRSPEWLTDAPVVASARPAHIPRGGRHLRWSRVIRVLCSWPAIPCQRRLPAGSRPSAPSSPRSLFISEATFSMSGSCDQSPSGKGRCRKPPRGCSRYGRSMTPHGAQRVGARPEVWRHGSRRASKR